MWLCTFLSTVLTTVGMVSHKGVNNNQDVPTECHHASICDSKRSCGGLAGEEKAIFVIRLLGPILPVHFHRFHRKKYLRSWVKSHQRASPGPLRASTTKRSPYHFQYDHILQFPICVLKNLMVTSSASIHTYRRHSHDKDSLSCCWLLRLPSQAH